MSHYRRPPAACRDRLRARRREGRAVHERPPGWALLRRRERIYRPRLISHNAFILILPHSPSRAYPTAFIIIGRRLAIEFHARCLCRLPRFLSPPTRDSRYAGFFCRRAGDGFRRQMMQEAGIIYALGLTSPLIGDDAAQAARLFEERPATPASDASEDAAGARCRQLTPLASRRKEVNSVEARTPKKAMKPSFRWRRRRRRPAARALLVMTLMITRR